MYGRSFRSVIVYCFFSLCFVDDDDDGASIYMKKVCYTSNIWLLFLFWTVSSTFLFVLYCYGYYDSTYTLLWSVSGSKLFKFTRRLLQLIDSLRRFFVLQSRVIWCFAYRTVSSAVLILWTSRYHYLGRHLIIDLKWVQYTLLLPFLNTGDWSHFWNHIRPIVKLICDVHMHIMLHVQVDI